MTPENTHAQGALLAWTNKIPTLIKYAREWENIDAGVEHTIYWEIPVPVEAADDP